MRGAPCDIAVAAVAGRKTDVASRGSYTRKIRLRAIRSDAYQPVAGELDGGPRPVHGRVRPLRHRFCGVRARGPSGAMARGEIDTVENIGCHDTRNGQRAPHQTRARPGHNRLGMRRRSPLGRNSGKSFRDGIRRMEPAEARRASRRPQSIEVNRFIRARREASRNVRNGNTIDCYVLQFARESCS